MERTGFHKQDSLKRLADTSLPPMEPAEESIPRSIVPYSRDDDKARYLGLRASGFGIREALGLIGKAQSTLSLWRKNSVFAELENQLPELRHTLALEYASLEFLRNYRLVLEKDYRVIKDSLHKHIKIMADGKQIDVGQNSQDFQYLLRMRAHYTPQQLQAIEQVMGKGKSDEGDGFNWTDFVLTLERKSTTEKVKIETRHRQSAELSPIEDIEGVVLDASETDYNSQSKNSQSQEHSESSAEPVQDEGA